MKRTKRDVVVPRFSEGPHYAEQLSTGAVIKFASPPQIKVGNSVIAAGQPTDGECLACVAFSILGVSFVRFALGGNRWGEPVEVLPNQPCQWIPSYAQNH